MNLLKYDRPYEGMVNLSGNYIAFAINCRPLRYLKEVANKGCKLANKQKIWLLKMKSAIIRLKVSNKGSSFSLFQEFGRDEMLEC